MSSVFTKIVRGELPCYKIYEDERTLAFLDIEPEAAGHTLVIPKAEVDRVYDLSDEDYVAVMETDGTRCLQGSHSRWSGLSSAPH